MFFTAAHASSSMSLSPSARCSHHEGNASLLRRSPHVDGVVGENACVLSSLRSQWGARKPRRPRAVLVKAHDLRGSFPRHPQALIPPINDRPHASDPKDVSSDCTIEKAMEEEYRVRMGFVDDYVCAFCDDGGNLIWCEGNCGRLFHPTKPDGVHSRCQTLGLSTEQVEQLVFLCKNCEYKQHQCVVCGSLGSSDKSSDLKYVEVFQCNKKGCKRFYHPECIEERDYNKSPQDFECPMHECWSCKIEGREAAGKQATPEGNERTTQTKGKERKEMRLVQCRRCSKAYHRKCLPSGISSRTWKTTGGRILFYCMDHKMVNCLRSARRDHLRFPEIEVENRTSLQRASKKRSVPEGQADHGNKRNRAPEQAETPRHSSVDHNEGTGSVAMESLAPKSSFPGSTTRHL